METRHWKDVSAHSRKKNKQKKQRRARALHSIAIRAVHRESTSLPIGANTFSRSTSTCAQRYRWNTTAILLPMRFEPNAVCRQEHARALAHVYAHVYRYTDTVVSGKHVTLLHTNFSNGNRFKIQSGSPHALEYHRVIHGSPVAFRLHHRMIDSFWGLTFQHRDMMIRGGAVDVSGKSDHLACFMTCALASLRTHIHTLHFQERNHFVQCKHETKKMHSNSPAGRRFTSVYACEDGEHRR